MQSKAHKNEIVIQLYFTLVIILFRLTPNIKEVEALLSVFCPKESKLNTDMVSMRM